MRKNDVVDRRVSLVEDSFTRSHFPRFYVVVVDVQPP
jgi:hypothetical protein